jgi:hypothetical protein
VTTCRHNVDFQCQANSIGVGLHNGKIRCLNYSSR